MQKVSEQAKFANSLIIFGWKFIYEVVYLNGYI